MGVAHVGLVHHDPCGCKIKGFRAVSSIERNVSKRGTCKGSDRSSSVLFPRMADHSSAKYNLSSTV